MNISFTSKQAIFRLQCCESSLVKHLFIAIFFYLKQSLISFRWRTPVPYGASLVLICSPFSSPQKLKGYMFTKLISVVTMIQLILRAVIKITKELEWIRAPK